MRPRRKLHVEGDTTEIPRRQGRQTKYVGKLSDGKTKGLWLLVLASPFRGRPIPSHFITCSSRTIRQESSSRNLHHCRALEGVKHLLGDKPLALGREFSYLELSLDLMAEAVHFVIRLHTGSHRPTLLTPAARLVDLVVSPGEEVIDRAVL